MESFYTGDTNCPIVINELCYVMFMFVKNIVPCQGVDSCDTVLGNGWRG